jgi:hypothetical protein
VDRGAGVTAEDGVDFGVGLGVGSGVGGSGVGGSGVGGSGVGGSGVGGSGVGVSLTSGSKDITFVVVTVFSPLLVAPLAPNE